MKAGAFIAAGVVLALILGGFLAYDQLFAAEVAVEAPVLREEMALDLFRAALQEVPSSAHGHEASVLNGSAASLSVRAFADPVKGILFAEVEGRPEGLDGEARELVTRWGRVQVLLTKDLEVLVANGTARARPRAEAEVAPFLQGIDPRARAAAFVSAEVETFVPVIDDGREAVDLSLRSTEAGREVTAQARILRDPPRLLALSATLPALDGGLVSGGLLSARFLYDDAASFVVPAAAERAGKLAFTIEDGYGSTGPLRTWTFVGSGGILATEIEARVKAPGSDPLAAPTLWTFRLSEMTAGRAGASLTFLDAASDGFVSPGDRLVLESSDGELPEVVLFDSVTGMNLVPGLPLAALLAMTVGLAQGLRRRSA